MNWGTLLYLLCVRCGEVLYALLSAAVVVGVFSGSLCVCVVYMKCVDREVERI